MAKDYNDYYPLGLNHKTGNIAIYDPVAVPYNYKFQEQELQETGFYAFKWRNYDPSMGRFFNVDPLSEKYAYQSHYNFSENRLTDGRELEGLERIDINGDFMDYQEAAEFARNTGSYFNFRDGEIPEIWKDIQEVVIQGGNREARSSSDQNDASMASNDFDSQEEVTVYGKAKSSSGSTGAVGEIISNIWNSDFARSIVPDRLGFTINVSAGSGLEFVITGGIDVLTRGKDAGVYVDPFNTGGLGVSVGAGGTGNLNFFTSRFSGKVSDMSLNSVVGAEGYISGTAALIGGVNGGYSVSFDPNPNNGPVLGRWHTTFGGVSAGAKGSISAV